MSVLYLQWQKLKCSELDGDTVHDLFDKCPISTYCSPAPLSNVIPLLPYPRNTGYSSIVVVLVKNIDTKILAEK